MFLRLIGLGILLVPLLAIGESNARIFYVEDIKGAMTTHLSEVVSEAGEFHVHDDVRAEDLVLRFVQIHDPVRQMSGGIYFACTDFHVDGDEEQLYDIDFWLHEVDGVLKVFRTKIHKEPRRSLLYGWYKHPRYTFVGDDIQYLYED